MDLGGSRDGGRRTLYAVVLVMSLAVFGLYVALGGPVPFLVDGGPSLSAVPPEADAVAYTDAWLFSSETNREIADGLLATTNRSLPGYTGPASLGAAFETLQDTDLEPKGLRSITAFGGYAPGGRPSDYRAIVLKTSWNTDPLLGAFGGNATDYERRTYDGTTVYVHEDDGAEFPWVGVLGPDQYALGNETAVRDAIDTSEGRTDGMDPTLESGFRSLGRAPIRFAATMPETIPGDALAPQSVTDTIDSIETVGGVYYPDGRRATVELELTATDGDTAGRIEPAIRDGLTFARENAPDDTAKLLSGASVSRTDTVLEISLSGSARKFVSGYRAFLESSVVRLLLGQPVGDPAVEMVPAGADLLVYGDASVVADTTTFRLAGTLASEQEGASAEQILAAIEQLRQSSALDPTAVRSVTLFARGVTSTEVDTDAAVIVEADWSARAVEGTLANSSIRFETRTLDGVRVFDLDSASEWTRLAVTDDGHLVLGAPDTVADVLAVRSGEHPALDGPVRETFDRLPRGYVTAVTRPPPDLETGLPTPGFLDELTVLGFSYDSSPTNVSVQGAMAFETADTARNAVQTLAGVRGLLAGQIDDDRVAAVVRAIELDHEERLVTGTVETDPGSLVAVAEWLLSAAETETNTTRASPQSHAIVGTPEVVS